MTLLVKRVAACAGLLLAGSLLVGCSDGAAVDAQESELDKIDEAVTAAMALEGQIRQVTNRLVVDCMTDAGFDTHPADLTEQSEVDADEEYKPLIGSEPPDAFELPTLEQAEEVGFDVGTYLDPDFEWEDVEGHEEAKPDPYYDELTDKYRQEYDQARYGEEYFEYLSTGEPPKGSDSDLPPIEAGCTGEVNEAIYGQSTTLESDGEPYTVWGPQWPKAISDWEGQVAAYENDTLLDARDKWAACVEDKGHPYFEYKDAAMGVRQYVSLFYEDGGAAMGMNPSGPEADKEPRYEAPKGAPWPFKEAYDKEIALAVDVANCTDDTGLRKTMQTEWNKVMEQIAVDAQAEIFAWHDDLEGVLAKAQDLLEA